MSDNKSVSAKKIMISVGSIIILVLAAISFIFIPAMVQGGGSELPPLGYYNKKPIEYKQGTYFTSLVQFYSEQVGSENLQAVYFDIFNKNIFCFLSLLTKNVLLFTHVAKSIA